MAMDQEIKAEARRQYFKYFRVWLIATAILLVAAIVATAVKYISRPAGRGNTSAPAERVYDFADVLTDEEEKELRAYIAECEEKAKIDIVIVTTNEPFGLVESEKFNVMMNYADDFWDERMYGYNRAYGDGALLLDNWYKDEQGSQMGTWLSTSGKMESIVGAYEEDQILDAMYAYIEQDAYKAYRAAVKQLAYWGAADERENPGLPLGAIVFLPLVIAAVYIVVHLRQAPAKDTTAATAYVAGGKPIMKEKTDTFLRKSVTKRRIETSSGGGGGGGSHSGGGSGGHHTSSGGHSHGGGGRSR